MKRIAIFTGNRAEFGILFPIIIELNNKYSLDIIVSGAHVLPRWNTYQDVVNQLDNANINYNLYRIDLDTINNVYATSLGIIYEWALDYYQKQDVEYGIVLGDRVESFGFGLATFYSRVPLIHFCGGDVVDVSNFDTNVRHSITKIANYHMVTNELSRSVVLQLGEEEERVINIGNPSFDYERIGYLTSKEILMEKYGLQSDDYIGVLTYHPSADRTVNENFTDFLKVFSGIVESQLSTIFITYPNNDPGHEKIVDYIEKLNNSDRVKVVKSFGTFNYLGIMNNFKVLLIGNSSSGLLETPYYLVPVINVGDRQKGRIRCSNVFDCQVESQMICSKVNSIIADYDNLKTQFQKERFFFGNGKAALKVVNYLESINSLSKEEKIFKKFVVKG